MQQYVTSLGIASTCLKPLETFCRLSSLAMLRKEQRSLPALNIFCAFLLQLGPLWVLEAFSKKVKLQKEVDYDDGIL